MNGVLLLNKPAGPTSHDIVDLVRRLTGTRRVGHAGTLDPFATGLLVLLVGSATRVSQFLLNQDKSYLATIAYGEATDTLDRTGKVTETCTTPLPPREEIERVLASFIGRSEQIPPMFSAKKVNGKPLYRAARRGEEVNRESKLVSVYSLDLLDVADQSFSLRVHCSKGTYVRVLADAIARRLGGCGHLEALRRESSGCFNLADALTLEQAQTYAADGRLATALLPIDAAVLDLPRITLTASAATALKNGIRPVNSGIAKRDYFRAGQAVRLVDEAGLLLAMARTICDSEELVHQPDTAQPFELLRVFALPGSPG